MSTRPPQPPAKQFILRQRATDAELLELYFKQDEHLDRIHAIMQKAEAAIKEAQEEVEAERAKLQIVADKIMLGRKPVEIPVIAVMQPPKNVKTLYHADDIEFKNPIETVPMKPEDYELPLPL